MNVWREPRELIAAVADYVELPGAAQCCGSAGTYSLLRPRDSRRVLSPKLDQIEAAGVDYVVAVNPGCLRQLQVGLRQPGDGSWLGLLVPDGAHRDPADLTDRPVPSKLPCTPSPSPPRS